MPGPTCHHCKHPIGDPVPKFCPNCGTPTADSPQELRGRSRRWVTILFADIVGFTSLSELHEPDEIGSLLDQILYPLTEIILEEGGVIDKYIGDAIMALFGAHTSSHHDSGNAINAALRMQEKVTQLSHQFEKEFGRGIQLRVGINTGKVLAGPIGAPPYRQFTVIGDAVNLASRLESVCEPGRVLVGANTQRFAHNEFEMESGGLISIKGKVNKVAAYYPLYAKQRTSVDVAEHFNGIPIPFLGRDEEVSAIVSEFNKCKARSDNALISVNGADSIGKSRLILRSIERIYAGKTDIFYLETGHASRQFLTNFSHPLKSLVQTRYETVDNFIRTFQKEYQTKQKNRSLVSIDLLFRFLSKERHRDEVAIDANSEEQQQLLRAVIVAFNFLHQVKPIAIWIRLTERIDHDVGQFLDYIADTKTLAPSLPIFVEETVNAGSSDSPGERESIHCNIIIPLEPMGEHLIRSLTHSLLQTAGGAPEWLTTWLAEASAGRPGFALEYLNHLVEKELIQIDSSLGHWFISESKPDDFELPDSINVLLQTELDCLTEAERRALSCSALLDRPFSEKDVVNAVSLSELEVHDALEKFTERKLLLRTTGADDQDGYQFRTSSLRQVAEDALTLEDRRKTHCLISEYLRTTKADPGLIAAHYLQGQNWAQALSFTMEAIHIATASFALQRAMAYLSQAKFLMKQAQGLLTPDEEILSALQMKLIQAEIAFYNGDTEGAQTGLEQVLHDSGSYKLGQSTQSPQFRHSLIRLRAFATKLGGNLATRLANHSEAIEFFEQALQDLCMLHRPPSEICSIEASISWAHLRAGNIGEAKLRSEVALESMHLQLKPDPMMRDAWARHYDTLGNIAMQDKRLHDAHALFLAAQALRRINGSVSLLAHSAGNIAGVLALKGDWASSAEAFEQVAEQWASLGNSEMELIGRLNLIECLLEIETPMDAERKNRINTLLDASDKLLKPLGSPQLEGILAGHRERALSVFALSSDQNFQ
jgi:class 3 adenylate cyclase/tetratricopeptide (TPR) repeat protein